MCSISCALPHREPLTFRTSSPVNLLDPFASIFPWPLAAKARYQEAISCPSPYIPGQLREQPIHLPWFFLNQVPLPCHQCPSPFFRLHSNHLHLTAVALVKLGLVCDIPPPFLVLPPESRHSHWTPHSLTFLATCCIPAHCSLLLTD